MKNLFDPASVEQIKGRLENLRPESKRLWGKMSPAQAVAHCALSMEWAVGDSIPEGMPLMRVLGFLVKPLVLNDDKPMRRNSPTAKTLVIQDGRDLAVERVRLLGLIDRFATAGPAGCTKNAHSFFGKMTPEEWAILTYKHLDHHLRQFGV
jgi:hypothetical protein